MAKGSSVFFGFMIAFFIIINGLIVWAIFVEKNKLNNCVNNQSAFCPVVVCNKFEAGDPRAGDPPNDIETAAAKDCVGYAYRYTNDEKTEWECNLPLF